MFGYDVFGAPALSFAASSSDPELTMGDLGGLFWQGKSSKALTGGGKEYYMKSIMITEPDPYNAGQTRNTSVNLSYVWPDTQVWTGHHFKITNGPRTIIWTSPILGDMASSNRSNVMTTTFKQEIINKWDQAIFVPESCNTTDTYVGLDTGCTGGGNRCTDNSEGLQAGEIIKVANYSKTSYSDKTIPAGTVVCPGTLSGVGSCASNEEKVLNYSFTGITGGIYVCVTKSGCPDEHNSDYKAPSLGYKDDYAACGTDCITGASKTILGAGNGSCILKIDEWNDGVAENQAGQKSMTVVIGKSGHVSHPKRYLVIYKNADSSLNYKAGSNGFKSYATEAEATTAFNLAAGRRKAILNPPEIIDDDGVIDCTDSNRNTKSDGSCSVTCNSGYDFGVTGLCEEEESGSINWTYAGFIGGIGLLAVLAMK